MKYIDIAMELWNFSATYVVTEHSIWKQLFLTNGNGMDWRNGELQYRFHEKHTQGETLADAALDMVKDRKLADGQPNYKDASYWFDHYYVERQVRLNPKKRVGVTYIDTKDYNLLWRIPDNITDEWVKVVNRCIKWMESIDEESFTNYNLKTRKQEFFGCLFEKYEPQVLEAHPDWKVVREEHRKKIKNMEWIEKVMFRDAAYEKVHANICNAIKEITDPLAEKEVKGHFNRMQELIKFVKERLTSLGKSTEDLSEPLNLTREASIPDWYIKPADRPDKLFIGNDRKAITLDSPWYNDFSLEELRALLPA